jgi:hypothetical protein
MPPLEIRLIRGPCAIAVALRQPEAALVSAVFDDQAIKKAT